MSEIVEMIEDLRAPNDDMVLYAIVFRNAGVAFQFYDNTKVTCPLCRSGYHSPCDRWREGLVVERYHETFEAAVKAEHARFFPPPGRPKLEVIDGEKHGRDDDGNGRGQGDDGRCSPP